MPLSFTRTLQLKVRAEAYAWLNTAAVEVRWTREYASKLACAQRIKVGDVSSLKLVKTRMAKSVLDSGWGMLKRLLEYKCQQAARSFAVTSERNTSGTCSACGALRGPRGVNGLIVR